MIIKYRRQETKCQGAGNTCSLNNAKTVYHTVFLFHIFLVLAILPWVKNILSSTGDFVLKGFSASTGFNCNNKISSSNWDFLFGE